MTTVTDGLYELGGVPVNSPKSLFGNTWYVDCTNGHDENTGKSPKDTSFNTIAKAIERGAAGDTIVMSPGTHSVDVSVGALVPKEGMNFYGAVPPLGGMPSTYITPDADDGVTMIEIDVDNVGFHGIKFLMVAGGTTCLRLVSAGQTTAIDGLTFRDCWFHQNEVDAAIISLAVDDASNAVYGMVVTGCRFCHATTTTGNSNHISVGVGGIQNSLIEHNVFTLDSIDGTSSGIRFADPTTAKASYGYVIRENDFIGATDGALDAVGIIVDAAGEETELLGAIRMNFFANCAPAAVTIDTNNASMVQNFFGETTVGGTLVVPGT